MKLSEILGWINKDNGSICTWLSNGRESDAYIDGYNTALTSCDREIDKGALIQALNDYDNTKIFNIKTLADHIISTMPNWLKRIEK